jgi:hypothetical protein
MCRYRFGDAINHFVVYFVLLALLVEKALTNPWYLIGVGLMAISWLVCAALNNKERQEDDIQKQRELYQLSLGVPPDEI